MHLFKTPVNFWRQKWKFDKMERNLGNLTHKPRKWNSILSGMDCRLLAGTYSPVISKFSRCARLQKVAQTFVIHVFGEYNYSQYFSDLVCTLIVLTVLTVLTPK